MQKFFIPILQKALNHYLRLDPESSNRLRELQGKKVSLELLGMGLTFQLHFTEDSIQIVSDELVECDTHIKGTPLSLLRMTLTEGDRKHFFKDDVSIEGNLDLGQQVIDLFDQLEIDWEEYVSRWVGDVPAHQFGRLLGKIQQFSERVQSTFTQNINEYVHEEIDYFPPREAIQDYFSDVDVLRMDVDRIEARVQQLTQKVREKM